MTPKQILDSFSQTLMQDERILSAQERALVATLLQHAKTATVDNQETQEAVMAVIASAVGETVAQRAFAVLGCSIVERILEGGTLPPGDSAGERTAELFAGPKKPSEPQPPSAPMRTPGEPQPPSHGPGPGIRAPHKEPHTPQRDSEDRQPPSHGPGPGIRAPHKEPHTPQRDIPVPPSSPKEPQPPSAPMRAPGEPQPPPSGLRSCRRNVSFSTSSWHRRSLRSSRASRWNTRPTSVPVKWFLPARMEALSTMNTAAPAF